MPAHRLIASALALAAAFAAVPGAPAAAQPLPVAVAPSPGLVARLPDAFAVEPLALEDRSGEPPLTMRGAGSTGRLTVPVTVAGSGPFRFIVDTGSERTVISRELADRLKLRAGRAMRVHSMVGLEPVTTAVIPRLRLSEREQGEIQAPVLERADIGADGMLGVDSLVAQRILFDFKRNLMSIAPARRGAQSLGDGTIVVSARSRQGRLVVADAEADGRAVTAIIDTGAQVTIGNPALRRLLVGRGGTSGGRTVTILAVTGSSIEGDYRMLDELRIGGVRLRNVLIVFADAHSFRPLGLDRKPALLLGMNVMRAFDRVGIDFANRKLRLLPPKSSWAGGAQLALRGDRER